MNTWPKSLPVPDSVADFLQAVGRSDPVFELKLDQCALLVIDMQNDFILPGAPLEGWNCMAIVPKIAELVLFFRAHGRPVIWTKHIHQLNDIGILAPMWPATGPDSRTKALVKGTPGVEIVADLPAPAEDELVIEKHRYSAFYQTDLELNLRTMDVKTLLITGVNTDICCESTARDGFIRDFQIMSVSDGQTAITRELHEAALVSALVSFGRVAETAQVIEELEQSVN